MVLLPFTNIVVDQFSLCKKNKFHKYIHFLTHMHSDHFIGMTAGWNYGKIYCSEISSKLLIHKFPDVKQVIPLLLNVRYTIQICDKISINVTLLDANHCPGAVMFLFEGYMGTYLYTGDIRFDKDVFKNYPEIYPDDKTNENFEGCSKKIDILFLDNTFCDPVFTFPPRSQVLKDIEDLVSQCRQNAQRVLIALDNLGKQQILVHLAYKFLSLVVVTIPKYQSIINCEIDSSIFTTITQEGWIEAIPKKDMKRRLAEDPDSVGIIPTGWCNKKFTTFGGRLHMFPYSLHSNFQELQTFVKSIKPAKIQPIVRNFDTKVKLNEDYGEIVRENTIYKLSELNQRGLPELQREYCTKVYSEAHKDLFHDVQLQQQLSKLWKTQQKKQDIFYCNGFRKSKDLQKIIRQNALKRKPEPIKMIDRDDSLQIEQIRSKLNFYKKQHQEKLNQQGLQISSFQFLNQSMSIQRTQNNNSSPFPKVKSKKVSKNDRKTIKIASNLIQVSSLSSIRQQQLQESNQRFTRKNFKPKRQRSKSPVELKIRNQRPQPCIEKDSKIIKTWKLQNYFSKLVKQEKKKPQVIFLDD